MTPFPDHGNNFGIGYEDLYSINEIARMFGYEVEFFPERKGNRDSSELILTKIKELCWK